MKTIKLHDVSELRNELARLRKGKKLEIHQFNQAARLAWLGRVVLAPLDPDDPACKALLLYCERPDGIAAELIEVDEPLYERIHVLDAEQGTRLKEILREGIEARVAELRALNGRDFYFDQFFDRKPGGRD
jgi:hypothetical protein